MTRSTPRTALWISGFAVQAVVVTALCVRWAGSGRPQPPSLLVSFVLGSVGLVVALRFGGLRRSVTASLSWCALGYVVVQLVRLQASTSRALPGMYVLVYVGAGLLAVATVWQVIADRSVS